MIYLEICCYFKSSIYIEWLIGTYIALTPNIIPNLFIFPSFPCSCHSFHFLPSNKKQMWTSKSLFTFGAFVFQKEKRNARRSATQNSNLYLCSVCCDDPLSIIIGRDIEIVTAFKWFAFATFFSLLGFFFSYVHFSTMRTFFSLLLSVCLLSQNFILLLLFLVVVVAVVVGVFFLFGSFQIGSLSFNRVAVAIKDRPSHVESTKRPFSLAHYIFSG